jgi:NAD+ diphosphatase
MPSTLPTLAAIHDEDTSALTQKFGPGLTNYFSGSPLNRLSFLRGDPAFLTAAASHPQARFVILNEFAPLVRDVTSLHCVGLEHVADVTGREPFKLSEEEACQQFDSSKGEGPILVFLGLWEKEEGQGPEPESE